MFDPNDPLNPPDLGSTKHNLTDKPRSFRNLKTLKLYNDKTKT